MKKPSRGQRAFSRPAVLAIAVIVSGIGAAYVLSRPPSPAPPAAATDPTPLETRAEFLQFAERLAASDHLYFGTAQLTRIEKKLPTVRDRPLDFIRGTAVLGNELLRLGEVERAIEKLREAKRLALEAKAPAEITDVCTLTLGIAFMRGGELQNCCSGHTPDSCIMPIRGAGVHADRSGVDAAAAEFLLYLSHNPEDPTARWLLNVAHMAAGDWPDAVPEPYRIRADKMRSERDVGRFADIAQSLGVDPVDRAGGAIADDFDNDGFLDLVSTGSLPSDPMHYFHNNGKGGFEDQTERAGLSGQLGGLNCLQVDYNGDGWLDIHVLRGGWMGEHARAARNSLLRNNGDGTFTDVTSSSGILEPRNPTQTADWADYDRDGDLDCFVGNEAPLDGSGRGFPSNLWRNNGNGTFTDVAVTAGVTNERYTKGVAWGDYDQDGDADLYVSNIGPNRLYRNNGDGTFTDVAPQLGVVEPVKRSFATWFFDFDNDGDLDLFVAAYQGGVGDVASWYFDMPDSANRARLYRNNGKGGFDDIHREVGLDRPMLPMGANFGDLDNDGWLDFYLGTGTPNYEALTPNLMFRNDGGRRFQDVTFAAGLGHLQKGHGVAWGDLDNDGDQDIYHQLGGFVPGDAFQNVLFQNPGHGNHWLTLRLVGTTTNRFAIGSRIKVVVQTPAGSREIYRWVGQNGSFGGSSLQQEIGLADATAIERVEVTWQRTGTLQAFAGFELDQFYDLREGEAEARRVVRPRIVFSGAR